MGSLLLLSRLPIIQAAYQELGYQYCGFSTIYKFPPYDELQFLQISLPVFVLFYKVNYVALKTSVMHFYSMV
jgi:hypothetical protein